MTYLLGCHRGITSASGQKRNRTGTQIKLPRVFQPAIFSPKTQQQVETYPRLKQSQPLPQGGEIQNGDTGNYQDILQQGEWVTSIDFKDAYFHIPIQEQSRKYLRFNVKGQTYQFKALPFGLSTAPLEFTVIAKEVKLMAIHKGIRIHQYLDDWLVRATSHRVCLQQTQVLVEMCQKLGWLVNLEKLELEPKQVFNFVGYQFDLQSGRVRPTPDRWQSLQDKILELLTVNSHRKTGSSRPTTYETHSVASQKQLESTGISGEVHSTTQIIAPTLALVASRKQCSNGSTFTPRKTCSADLYRRIKRRVGLSLKRAHCKRNMVPPGKQAAHKLPRTQSHISSCKTLPGPLLRQDSPGGNRQHHSSVLHKQGRRHEVRPIMCPSLEDLDLVFQKSSDLEGRHIPGRLNVVADKLSWLGQAIQTELSLLPQIFELICSRWH